MNIYFKRVKTYVNDKIHTDEVLFSLEKIPFNEYMFLKLNPSLDINQRKRAIASHLEIKITKVNLIKV